MLYYYAELMNFMRGQCTYVSWHVL